MLQCSVTLILVSGNEGGGQVHPHHLLELLFGSLVLLLGQGEVEGGDTETLKRSCKVSILGRTTLHQYNVMFGSVPHPSAAIHCWIPS